MLGFKIQKGGEEFVTVVVAVKCLDLSAKKTVCVLILLKGLLKLPDGETCGWSDRRVSVWEGFCLRGRERTVHLVSRVITGYNKSPS